MAWNGGYFIDTTGDVDDLTPSCQAMDGNDHVYYIPACGSRTITIDSCFAGGTLADTILYLRIGSCTAADAACSDDVPACAVRPGRESITAVIPKGLSFFIGDGQFASGSFMVSVSGL